MIKLIVKRFLKVKQNPNLENRHIYGLTASCVGIGLNVLLFVIKLNAALLSGSVSIIADAVNISD
ncbi:MAG TPA: cation-efflux pump, partial [Clostridiales bacterium]|nr:cation-efflux pump [Clostridiales bacterium]